MQRLNVNINEETKAALIELAAKRSITLTEVLRRATYAYKFLDEAQVHSDIFLKETDRRGRVHRTHLLMI
jgi:hypothetical protein